MIEALLFALWFFVPAGIANMTPVPIAKAPGLRRLTAPLDFGKNYKGIRIFGPHKTWRGLISGMIMATVVLAAQQYAVREYGWFGEQAAMIDYVTLPPVLLGALFAIGALGGDAVKSFFKRRRNVAPGQVWLPYDLVDHILGAFIIVAPFVVFDWWLYPVIIVVWPIANLGVSYTGYLLRIKERPF